MNSHCISILWQMFKDIYKDYITKEPVLDCIEENVNSTNVYATRTLFYNIICRFSDLKNVVYLVWSK